MEKDFTTGKRGLKYQLLHDVITKNIEPLRGKPIMNVNLLAFKGVNRFPGKGESLMETAPAFAQFLEYWNALTDLILQAGGKVVFVGEVAGLLGTAAQLHGWHAVAFVYYPSLAHYLSVLEKDTFLQIKHMRRVAVKSSVLYAAVALDNEDSSLEKAIEVLSKLSTRSIDQEVYVDILSDRERAVRSHFLLEGAAQLVGEAGYTPWRYFNVRCASGEPFDHNAVSLRVRPLSKTSLAGIYPEVRALKSHL